MINDRNGNDEVPHCLFLKVQAYIMFNYNYDEIWTKGHIFSILSIAFPHLIIAKASSDKKKI